MSSKSHFFNRGLKPFIATFRTTSANESVILPYDQSGEYSGTIDWGDGTITPNNFNNRSHTYLTTGDYDVVIKGDISSFTFNNSTSFSKLKIINLKQWGNSKWLAINFYGCTNLDVTATDIPNLSKLTNLVGLFRECTNLVFNDSINNWDVSNINSFLITFRGCANFNQPLNNWDVSNSTTFEGCFFGCSIFNQDISNWNISNALKLRSMFVYCQSFNQDISNWNTSNVNRFDFCFSDCVSFNKDISNWNFSSVNILNSFDNFMRNKTQTNYDSAYYDNLLIKWASDESLGGLPVGVVGELDMGSIKYTSLGASARQSILDNNKATTITDGGQV